ncbi:uncharacterized protein [Vulpes vulpes]|uniref:Basic proline-rich protein-like n=1 Tax=Vulpes vulpes TaxID=9627 RepID=A0ABM4YLV0_VULVU
MAGHGQCPARWRRARHPAPLLGGSELATPHPLLRGSEPARAHTRTPPLRLRAHHPATLLRGSEPAPRPYPSSAAPSSPPRTPPPRLGARHPVPPPPGLRARPPRPPPPPRTPSSAAPSLPPLPSSAAPSPPTRTPSSAAPSPPPRTPPPRLRARPAHPSSGRPEYPAAGPHPSPLEPAGTRAGGAAGTPCTLVAAAQRPSRRGPEPRRRRLLLPRRPRRGSPASRGRVGGAPAAGPGELSCPATLPSAGRASPHCSPIWRSGPPRAWQSVPVPPTPAPRPPRQVPGRARDGATRPGPESLGGAQLLTAYESSRAAELEGQSAPPPHRRRSGDSAPEACRPRARVTSGGPSRRRGRVSATEWALPRELAETGKAPRRRRAARYGCGKHREDFPEKVTSALYF